ncbi:MAG: hypothetical protein KKF50_02835 [Nanoarchaeota archaeon]|nr:hypothetical protein [Nanoarchaeota archaeon]
MSLQQLNSNFNSLPKQFSSDLEDSWIAVLEGKIVFTDRTFKEVFNKATSKGISKKVLFHKVPKKEIIIV